MEIIEIKNLSFAYPQRGNKALEDICLTIHKGEFITLCGKSGCGKTTLLRLLKSAVSPFGEQNGEVLYAGTPLSDIDSRSQAAQIGFVMQSPDNQIVTDKVWHELAFGLESLGYEQGEIRARVAEMASFFGIEAWFYKNVTELSGGQKQLLNLASVMAMQPDVLILDEPTSQLDPIAAGEFIKTLEKINRELGTTIILSEHRLEEAFPVSHRVVVMDEGRIISDGEPRQVGENLKSREHPMYQALPAPMRIHMAVGGGGDCPVTVREGRAWLEEYTETTTPDSTLIPAGKESCGEIVIELKDLWFRYEKNLPDVIKGLNATIRKGEIFALVGGNGTGKTTALSLISGLNTPYRGDVYLNGKSISKIANLYNGVLAVLPQNPQSVFAKKTVYLDLMDMMSDSKLSKDERERRIRAMACLCHIDTLLDSHPYDLSGGEQQRAALAKVLLKSPEILLLDEPTKGLDAHFKREFAHILGDLKAQGVTVVMVSHDIEFCAEFADRCAMFFDGTITSAGEPRRFFSGKSFYTTSANRMARTTIPQAVLADDVILALGGDVPKEEKPNPPADVFKADTPAGVTSGKAPKLTWKRITAGSIFALFFVLISLSYMLDVDILHIGKFGLFAVKVLQIVNAAIALFCFFPHGEIGFGTVQTPRSDRKLTKRTLAATLLILLMIPLTVYAGIFFLGDRKYYFISLLIILETMIPFAMVFEDRKPQARELVIISVLCALGVAGRTAFFMLPQFKPVVALVIISGICFGGETGFLVGAVTGFVSNFFFGQGPWTPWQMFAFGIIGFLGGVLFKKGLLRKTRIALCIFGFFTTLIVYGGIVNLSSVITVQTKITKSMVAATYLSGLPMDIIHSAATAFFLWFIAEPMVDKLERVKVKYGLIER